MTPDPKLTPSVQNSASTEYAIAIYAEDGTLVVAIRRCDGGIFYGPAFTTEQEAARVFWDAMSEELRRWCGLPLAAPDDETVACELFQMRVPGGEWTPGASYTEAALQDVREVRIAERRAQTRKSGSLTPSCALPSAPGRSHER